MRRSQKESPFAYLLIFVVEAVFGFTHQYTYNKNGLAAKKPKSFNTLPICLLNNSIYNLRILNIKSHFVKSRFEVNMFYICFNVSNIY